ncbi:MAG TPA: Uma2 family endonuclease [Acidimicrobiia bacterium]|jgi:Uma2 family endonuclease|nr:Uma2 family endonuclease [Acidimicrobiia bacterium]
MSSDPRPSGGSTIADLEAMPSNDGQRYELIDGHIIVSPWPSHFGGVSFRLGPILSHAVPPGHASYRLCGLDLPDGQRIIPDLMIAPHSSVGDERVHAPVVLIVEVLCGLGEDDLARKRAAYAAAGVPAYWLIDPEKPMATCLRLEDGEYVTYAEGAVVEVDWPVAVTVDVAEVARPQAS